MKQSRLFSSNTLRRAIIAAAATIVASASFATDTWVQVDYTETMSVGGGQLTLNPSEITMSAPNTYIFNLNRIIMQKTVNGAVTNDPAWSAELTPLGYSNQTIYYNQGGHYAPNGYSVSIIYDHYTRYQKFRLYEDGEPVRDFVSRNGETNEDAVIYVTIY
ncbi:MAG: hypothetical protein ACKVQS_13700 [Fimbriimonadaceae bacterium]